MNAEEYSYDPEEFLRGSPLLKGLGMVAKTGIIKNPNFLEHGGMVALSLSFVEKPPFYLEAERAHVIRNLVEENPWMLWDMSQAGFGRDSTTLYPHNPEKQTLINLYLDLYIKLQFQLGLGRTVEDLSRRYCRSAQDCLDKNVPNEVEVERYIHTNHGKVRLPDRVYSGYGAGVVANEALEEIKDSEGKPARLSISELAELNDAIPAGWSPELIVRITDPDQERFWGEDLTRLTPEEIIAMADNAEHCNGSCQFYHGHVRELKNLGELIAPVDTQRFGGHLLERYKDWSESRGANSKFRVLVPAQADETTIAGILNYLSEQGVNDEEIRSNFHFELADLCVTPLLRVYAELKKRGLLEVAQITSTDVFKWHEYSGSFDFICSDHFIELFPPKGKSSQTKLLDSLLHSLSRKGQIVLTTRCGTLDKPLSSKSVIGDFYEKVDEHISNLTQKLEINNQTDSDATVDSHVLISLLLYRKLRKVYPFQTEGELAYLLETASNSFDHQITRLAKEKVKIVINKK